MKTCPYRMSWDTLRDQTIKRISDLLDCSEPLSVLYRDARTRAGLFPSEVDSLVSSGKISGITEIHFEDGRLLIDIWVTE